MALEKSFDTDLKTTFPNGYHRLVTLGLELTDAGLLLRLVVASWVNKTARQVGGVPARTLTFDYALPKAKGDFTIAECYQLLKNEPEFQEAVNV